MTALESEVREPSVGWELASRESDGVLVLLLWHPEENVVTVSVDNSRAACCFELAVDSERALDAFHRPFAYAA